MANDKKLVKRYGKIADQIIKLEPVVEKYDDIEFAKKTIEFKERIQAGETLDDILIEAYALVREATWRVHGMKAYRVQLIGGIILHTGDIAEMKTGEGKTLVGLFPAYLNSLSGLGVHIITVNEYLSRRDSEINGQVFDFLGVSVGLSNSQMSKTEKREAYLRDVTYVTNSELGFDYLKDNMVMSWEQKVQRGLNYAIIDEADSVLIDEARTPLIISGGKASRKNMYQITDQFSKTLKLDDDVDIDLESKQVYLNEQGMQKAKDFFSVKNLFAVENTELFHLIMNALKANFIFREGVEYTVKDNEIFLIDQFTGRIMEGRSYSNGLQQAIQAKENVEIEEETITVATITYQNFYRLYTKISGMTGTAKTEEEEFLKIYNTRVVQTPTNKPILRKDDIDYTFGTKNAALKYLVKTVQEVNEVGNPILIGTTSVESSEQIARYLNNAEIKYEVINAKNHDREADIVKVAGKKGAITLATNMAGRGTDIKLSDEVKAIGGLHVFGVERNEARRIDNQLRGRAGRQGDPGFSRFFISMEDDMMMRFTTPKLRSRFASLGDDFINSKMFTRAITNAQKKLEGMNFDQRKNVLDYDNILAQQRESIYAQRDDILLEQDLKNVLQKFQFTFAYEIIEKNSKIIHEEHQINYKDLIHELNGNYVAYNKFTERDLKTKDKMELAKVIADAMMEFYKSRIGDIPKDVTHSMELRTILESLDKYWSRHIDLSDKLKSGIYLQQYAQNNPLAEYVDQSNRMFNKMKIAIANEVCEKLSKVVIKAVESEQKPQQIEITDADIDSILVETNLTKYQLNELDIKERIAILKEEHKDNKEQLKKLQVQKDILLGLVIEIEKRFDEEKGSRMPVTKIKEITNMFGFNSVEEMTEEKIQSRLDEMLKNNTLNNEQKQFIIESKKLLSSIVLEINGNSQPEPDSQPEYVVEDEKGNVRKRIKTKGGSTEITEDADEIVKTQKIN